MKKLFFLFVLFIISCSTGKSRFETIKEKQEEQLKTGIRNDKIFMDFRFGMSQYEVMQRFNQLVDEGVFTINNEANYEYKIKFEYAEATVTFKDSYVNDSLCSLILFMEDDTPSKNELIQVYMAELLMRKYGKPLILESLFDKKENDYYFIVGNQQIEVLYPFMGSSVHVEYFDYLMKERKEKMKDEIKNEEENALLKNL